MKEQIAKYSYYTISIAIYVVLSALFIDKGYFGDNAQQIGAEANWFMNHGILSIGDDDYVGTGYHIPAIGYATAMLWKTFGQHVWVSHIYVGIWAILYLVFSYEVVSVFSYGWARTKYALCLVLPTTILSQFATASPDFIMAAAIAILLYGIVKKKYWGIAIGLLILSIHSMRGVFVGGCLSIGVLWQCHKKELDYKNAIISFSPTVIILVTYYSYYLLSRGWFFDNSSYAEHYTVPTSMIFIIKHFCSLVLRLVEYGRIFVWVIACIGLWVIITKKVKATAIEESLIISTIAILTLYVIFSAITQMPFATRYFIPLMYIVSLFTLSVLSRYFDQRELNLITSIILVGHITGHLWIYPEKTAQPWDSTLCHYGFYETKEEAMKYLECNNIESQTVASGFCLNMESVNYDPDDMSHSLSSDISSCNYYLYSNISNDDDQIVDMLMDKEGEWRQIVEFQHGYVFAKLFKRMITE